MPSSTFYAVLLALVLGVGCGKGNQTAKESPKENPSKADDKNSTKAKPDKELTEEDVVGSYEIKGDGYTIRVVLLENGIEKEYENGRSDGEGRWKIVDKEVHVIDSGDADGAIVVLRKNTDDSLTIMAEIYEDGKRKARSKEEQVTYNKIKSSTNTPPPERSLEVQFLDGELKRADLEEVTKLDLDGYQLTELPKNLENLTQLKVLVLSKNQLAKVPKGLEKLTQLERLFLLNNPNLTKAQISDLQKALPKCEIFSNPTK